MKPRLNNRDALLALPYVHERDGAAYVRVPYQDADGKWRSKEKKLGADASLADAINLIAQIKDKLGNNPNAIEGERMTFDDLLREYQRAYPTVPQWYLQPLDSFKGRKIRSLTYGDCARFKEAREQVPKANGSLRKPATIHRELEMLRRILLYAVRHGWLERNPMNAGPTLLIKGEEERRERIPTLEEEARLLDACVAPRAHLRGLIIATSDTGLRRSALLVLDWSLVDWEGRLLGVPRPKSRYKRRPKQIGLTERLWQELRQMWEQAGCPTEGRIFTGAADFKRSYKTACRLANVTGLRFNDFRHKFATDLMEADIPQRLAMKVAGHVNQATHDIYTNVDERLARQVANALDKLHEARRGEVSSTADGPPWPLASDVPQ